MRATMTTGDLSHTVTITAGDTVAEFVPAANMVCVSLRVGGVELLDPTHGLQAYADAGKTMGIPLLYPWANRLDHHGYEAAGKRVTLPDPDGRYSLYSDGLPIHGALPGNLVWEVAEQSRSDRVHARLAWDDPALLELFPFEHRRRVRGGRLRRCAVDRDDGGGERSRAGPGVVRVSPVPAAAGR